MVVEPELLGLNELFAVPKGKRLVVVPIFAFRDDRTDFVEPSCCSIAMRRSLLRLSCESKRLGVVSG